MNKRVLTALIMALLGVVAVAFSGIRFVVAIIVALLSVLCLYEISNISEKKHYWWVFGIGSAIAVACIFVKNIPYLRYIALTVFIVSVFVYGTIIIRAERKKRTSSTLWLIIVTAVMLVVFFICVVELRMMEYGLWYLLAAILTSIITDTAALFIGCNFGRHKLCPVVSPKKTVEGAVGGFVAAVVLLSGMGAVVKYAFSVPVDLLSLAMYSSIGSLIGQFGDLAMSVLKRGAGIKDFGNILPGHGGFLDRFDNMIFVWAFTYLFISYGFGFIG